MFINEGNNERRFKILLTKGYYTDLKRNEKMRNFILDEGETFLEYQDQYAGKWYERFMNHVRVKYGDGKTSYHKLPYMNGILNHTTRFFLTISTITVFQIILLYLFYSFL